MPAARLFGRINPKRHSFAAFTTKPEVPFEALLFNGPRTFTRARAAFDALNGGWIGGDSAAYRTPEGVDYVFWIDTDGVVTCTGPDRPEYVFTSNSDSNADPQYALFLADVSVGFKWTEFDERTSTVVDRACVANGSIQDQSSPEAKGTAAALARVITITGFTYPEFPFTQTTPGDLSTRSYDEAKAKMIEAGGVAGTDAIYTTPEGHRYTFGLRIGSTGELECIPIDGPDRPLYEFTYDEGVTEKALVPSQIKKGAKWAERNLADGAVIHWIATDDGVALEQGGFDARGAAAAIENTVLPKPRKFVYPLQWQFRPQGLNITRSSGRWSANADEYVSMYMPTGFSNPELSDIAWVSENGDDTGLGNRANPLASADEAIRRFKSTIYVERGKYINSWTEPLRIHTQIICPNSRAWLIRGVSGDGLTWVAENTAWTASLDVDMSVQYGAVYDYSFVDANGNPLEIERVNSKSECFTTSNSWFATANEITVNTTSGLLVDLDHLVISPAEYSAPIVNKALSLRLENITMTGGYTSALDYRPESLDCMLHTKNVKFHGGLKNAVIKGYGCRAVIEKTTLALSGSDCLNWHDTPSISCRVVEIDCVSRVGKYAGLSQGNQKIQNATTAHEAAQVIRVGGFYASHAGPTIADVNDAGSLNIGVTTTSENDAYYAALLSSTGYMGFVESTIHSNELGAFNGAGGTFEIDNSTKIYGTKTGSIGSVSIAPSVSRIEPTPSYAFLHPSREKAFEQWLDNHTVVAMIDPSRMSESTEAALTSIPNYGDSATAFTGNAVFKHSRVGYGGPVLDLAGGSMIASAGWTVPQASATMFIGEFGSVGNNERLWSNETDDNGNRQELFSSVSLTNTLYSSDGSTSGGVVCNVGESFVKRTSYAAYFDGGNTFLSIDGGVQGITSGTISGTVDGLRIGGDSNASRTSSPIIALAVIVTGIIDANDLLLGVSLASEYVSSSDRAIA